MVAWKVLPPGIHNATLEDVETRFATSDHRKHLFSGFTSGVMALRKAGCKKIFLDGSFVTEKPIPGDFDVCWDPMRVDHTKLDPVFLDFSDRRKKQKERFHGEFFPASWLAKGKHFFLIFFKSTNTREMLKVLSVYDFQRIDGRGYYYDNK